MSERPIDINLQPDATASDKMTDADRQNNEVVAQALSKAELKKRIAEIYDRGVVGDRLHVDLPPHIVGQWVPNDQQAVYRMESMGYTVDTEFAPRRRLHDKGDGASYVGDVIHMIAPREVRDVIDEVKRERYDRIHAKSGKQKEETDFESSQRTLSTAGIGTINESKTHSVNKDDIKRIIDPKT